MINRQHNNNDHSQNNATTRFSPFVREICLNLTRQELSDKDIPELVAFLQQNPRIRKLDLSLNNIGNHGLALLAEKNQTVIHVNLMGNNITDEGMASFASKNQHIQEINFSHNMISEQGIEIFVNLNKACFSTQFSKMKSQ